MKIVISFGAFDFFHPGHAYYLKQAKNYGDYLIVIIARDVNVFKIKNKTPQQTERIRKKNVNRFLKTEKIAGQAVLGSKNNFYNVFKKYQPTIIALGYDQIVDNSILFEKVKNYLLTSKVVRINSYQPKKYKSSIMFKKYGKK